MCVFVSRPMRIVTFLRKNRETPKRVVDFPRERDTFRNKLMEIVEDFEEKSYNKNGKPRKSSRILRVKPNFFICPFFFSSFFSIFSCFFSFFHFFIFYIFLSFFHFSHFFICLIFSSFFSFFSLCCVCVVCLCVCLFVCLFVCVCVCLFVCLFVCCCVVVVCCCCGNRNVSDVLRSPLQRTMSWMKTMKTSGNSTTVWSVNDLLHRRRARRTLSWEKTLCTSTSNTTTTNWNVNFLLEEVEDGRYFH